MLRYGFDLKQPFNRAAPIHAQSRQSPQSPVPGLSTAERLGRRYHLRLDPGGLGCNLAPVVLDPYSRQRSHSSLAYLSPLT